MASGARCSLRHRLQPAPSGNSGSLGKLLLPGTHCSAQSSPLPWKPLQCGDCVGFPSWPRQVRDSPRSKGNTEHKPWHLWAAPEGYRWDSHLLGSCLSTCLSTSGEHGHSPALCPVQPVASFPFISLASEVKCFQYFPPFFLSQQTTFILPSTRLFQGSMGHQNDELVPVVTVALSITADIPGGHMSPKDSSRLGNSTQRLKLSFAMKPPQSTRPAVQAGPSQTSKDLSELLESSRDTSTG